MTNLVTMDGRPLTAAHAGDLEFDISRARQPRYAAVELDWATVRKMKETQLAVAMTAISLAVPTCQGSQPAHVGLQMIPGPDGVSIKMQLQLRIFSALSNVAVGEAFHKAVDEEIGL